MSGRGLLGAAMAVLDVREAFAEARAAQRELVESEVASAVARLARESSRRANEERLGRALQWLGAHLLDALEEGRGLELARTLGGAEAESRVEVARGEEQEAREGAGQEVERAPATALVLDRGKLEALQAAMRDNQGRPATARNAGAREVADAVTVVSATAWPIEVTNALLEAGRLLGPTPARLSSGNAIEAEVGRLEEVMGATLGHWAAAGKAVDHALTSWVAARARAAQDAKAMLGAVRAGEIGARIDAIISGLGRHTKETWPGAVQGLARHHGPRNESWSLDASTWERKTRRLLPHGAIADDEVEVEVEVSRGGDVDNELRRLWEGLREGRAASELVSGLWQLVVERGMVGRGDSRVSGFLRGIAERETEPLEALSGFGLGSIGLGEVERAVRAELAEEAEVERAPLPQAWPGFAVARGVAAAIVGGVPRPERVEALRRCFGFGSLEWIANACDRPLEGVVQQMRSGSLQLVIVLSQLVSHAASDRLFAARQEGCRVVLANSYGVGGIRLALERYAALAMA